MELKLLVIRSALPEQLVEFYKIFGMTFEYHRHGNGPFHFSGNIGPTLLEIYPLAKGQEKADSNLRLGVGIDAFDNTVEELKRQGVIFHQEPAVTEWGEMAIVADPEGRKVELYGI